MSLRTLPRALAGPLLPLGTLQQAPGGPSSAAAASGGGWRHAWRRFSAAAEGAGET